MRSDEFPLVGPNAPSAPVSLPAVGVEVAGPSQPAPAKAGGKAKKKGKGHVYVPRDDMYNTPKALAKLVRILDEEHEQSSIAFKLKHKAELAEWKFPGGLDKRVQAALDAVDPLAEGTNFSKDPVGPLRVMYNELVRVYKAGLFVCLFFFSVCVCVSEDVCVKEKKRE